MLQWPHMKIAYVTPYDGERELVNELLSGHDITYLDQPLRTTIPESIRDADVLSVFVDSKASAEMLETMPNLKVIALRSTGFDHIAVAAARERSVVVSYVPHYGSQTVAEYTFALILALSRRAYPAYDLLRHDGTIDVKRFEGFDLCGKTLGVVGTGAIGRRVCEMAKGFRMKILASDLYPNQDCIEQCGVEYCDRERLFRESDIITLHIPSAPENKHLINDAAIATMKQSALLINTARGDLVDTVALLRAVKEGRLAGAGLDVYEGEQFIKDETQLLDPDVHPHEAVWRTFVAEHELLDLDTVIITPHVAFNSVEAKYEITKTTTENIAAAIAGTPQNTVPA